MKVRDIPIYAIEAAEWNPNEMEGSMRSRLRKSMERYGFLVPLVVRSVGDGRYETIGGAQRLSVLREMGAATVPCVVVEAGDAEARLLSQALNHIAGIDDLGLRAELVRDLLSGMPEGEVLSVLPETAESLKALASLGTEDLASHLEAWQHAQVARLRHFQAQLTQGQLKVVQNAVGGFMPEAREHEGQNPNVRGTALYLLCKAYLENASEIP